MINAIFHFWMMLRAWLSPRPSAPDVTREYRWESLSGIAARIRLSTVYPRYHCTFSEPMSAWERPDFVSFRDGALSEFERETGIRIFVTELGNEAVRPIAERFFAERAAMAWRDHEYRRQPER